MENKPDPSPAKPAAAREPQTPVAPRPKAIADLLDEDLPRPVVPAPSPNQAALRIPQRRDRLGSEARKNALTVALVIALPIVAVVAVGVLGSALLESRLRIGGAGPRPVPDVAAPSPTGAVDGRTPQRARPSESSRGDFHNARSGPAPSVGARDDSIANNTTLPAASQPVADAPESPAIEREPIPAAAAIAAATRRVRDAYSRDFREAQTPLNKFSLASALADSADSSSNDTEYRYALLDLARQVAVESGDARLLDRIVNQTAARYEIDPLELKFAGLCKMFDPEQDIESRRTLIQVSVTTADRLRDADRYPEAVKLTKLAFDAGRRFDDSLTTQYLGIRVKELADSQARYTAAQQALATLREHPDDPDANARVGEWYWIDKHDRQQAFGYLAKAGDYDLRWAAIESLAMPLEPARQIKLGDAWWDLAHKLDPGPKRTVMLRESLAWYKKVQATAPGIAAPTSPAPPSPAAPAKRIAELEREINAK